MKLSGAMATHDIVQGLYEMNSIFHSIGVATKKKDDEEKEDYRKKNEQTNRYRLFLVALNLFLVYQNQSI